MRETLEEKKQRLYALECGLEATYKKRKELIEKINQLDDVCSDEADLLFSHFSFYCNNLPLKLEILRLKESMEDAK